MQHRRTTDETAFDYRDQLQPMMGWADQELRSLPIWRGDRFEPGEIYFNLMHPEDGAFRASGTETVLLDSLYIRKSDISEDLWSRTVSAIGQEEVVSGNFAPEPGAFGREGAENIAPSRGGTGASDLSPPTDTSDDWQEPRGD
jgi:hypothetical protein